MNELWYLKLLPFQEVQMISMIDSSKLTETRKITTPKGSILEINMSDEFLQKVRKHFSLSDTDPISDYHLRMFIFGSVKTAIDKAEAHGGIEQS